MSCLDLIYRRTSNQIILNIKVVPKAGKNTLVGIEGNRLKVRIGAEPEKGKANEELIRFFSELFRLPRSRISLRSGEKSRNKQLVIDSVFDIEKFLEPFL